MFYLVAVKMVNIAKGTTDPRVEFITRSQFTNLEYITMSES